MSVLTLGTPTPRSLAVPTTPGTAAFPGTLGTYTDPTGAIIIPPGALDAWWAYRQSLGTTRGDVVCIGDSTTFGSDDTGETVGGNQINYSWCQRLRDDAVGFGMADGGKGMFAAGEDPSPHVMNYDAPEINGFVSNAFSGTPAGNFDNIDGDYWFDSGTVPGRQLVLQFRSTGARLWYTARSTNGDFTYSIDGGATQTVKAYTAGNTVSRYVYISGLAPNTTHTITITNLGVSTSGGPGSNATCYIAFAPVNATGFAVQKFAVNGDSVGGRFFVFGGTTPGDSERWQTPFGLTATAVDNTSTPPYSGTTPDGSYVGEAKINPVLGIFHLGFNDLSSDGAASGVSPHDLTRWTEYVQLAAGVCHDAGCSCLIVSGQLPYNSYWPTYGAARFNALKTQAAASGVGFVDLFYPVAGPSLSYAGGTKSPHLSKAQYQAQSDFLWNSLLGLTA